MPLHSKNYLSHILLGGVQKNRAPLFLCSSAYFPRQSYVDYAIPDKLLEKAALSKSDTRIYKLTDTVFVYL